MTKLNFLLFSFLAAAVLFSVFPCDGIAETLSARDIMLEAQDKQFPKNSTADITMILINKRGHQRVRKINSKRKSSDDGEGKSVAYFTSPADVKGTAFLVWEHDNKPNDTFIYLPALKKIRRIASEQKNQSFMGSDFSYSDMENRDVDDADHKILREEKYNEKACWVLESIAKPETDLEYSKTVAWVSKENLIPEKMDMYDKKGGLFKVMKVEKVGPVGDSILPLHFTMENIKKNHKTEIVLDNIILGQEIPDSEFTHRAIQRRR